MQIAKNRLDPSLLSKRDLEVLDQLSNLTLEEDRPALVGREGVRIELPNPIFHHLVRVVRAMKKGQVIVLLPEKETFTTQAAANFLGVSRPHLVKLLRAGEIKFHTTGTHRRIYYKDLLDYIRLRDKDRRETLTDLTDHVLAAGLYDKIPPPDDEG